MLRQVPKVVNDPEGSYVPKDLPPIVDAHVHIFPTKIFSAVWNWFAEHAWKIRYRLTSAQVFEFLFSRGISRIVALQYAHKPGIAAGLNTYMAQQCREAGSRVTGLATVFPGEEGAVDILEQAFATGLAGIKLHAHVQGLDMDAEDMQPVFDICQKHGRPLVIHAGREPKSPAYGYDPHLICSADRVERVLKNFPRLHICVPHLGFDELITYRNLLEKYDTLWLDTTMVLADYFPLPGRVPLEKYRADRIMYGSDFPNIPYAWDRELRLLTAWNLPRERLERLLSANAAELFKLDQAG